jgi:hypothetical protein
MTVWEQAVSIRCRRVMSAVRRTARRAGMARHCGARGGVGRLARGAGVRRMPGRMLSQQIGAPKQLRIRGNVTNYRVRPVRNRCVSISAADIEGYVIDEADVISMKGHDGVPSCAFLGSRPACVTSAARQYGNTASATSSPWGISCGLLPPEPQRTRTRRRLVSSPTESRRRAWR